MTAHDVPESEYSDASGPEAESLPIAPSLTVESMTFSDGTTIRLKSDDIVVFVGPNNAGKSVALRENEGHLSRNMPPPHVVPSLEIRKTGNFEGLINSIERYSHKSYPNGALHYTGSGYSIPASQLNNAWNKRLGVLRPFFCRRLTTENRISDSNPAPAFKVLSEAATRPIQSMYADSDVELRLSGYFKAAFDMDLVVMKAGGNEIPLLAGEREPLTDGEDRTTRSYLERLMNRTTPLHEQGDGMRSFASVILEMLANRAPSVLLLDEPEAFLHPPQARLIGEFLARERRTNSQMFIATHSSDVLIGLLTVAPEQLRVIRIQRDNNVNRVKELEKEKAAQISSDPLTRYSSVLSGIFHQRAIICESDADCQFYQVLLAQPSVYQGPHPDVLFLHASGKHRMANMAEALRALGVPVDIIADIDLIREREDCRRLVEVMGGKWEDIESSWQRTRQSIESRKPWLNADAISSEIRKILNDVKGELEFPEVFSANITRILKKASPWGSVKDAGESAIPSGEPTQSWKKLKCFFGSLGIWIVPVGELEGFCRTIGGHGPKWVQRVIESRALSDDPELEQARTFIRTIWSREF